MISDTDQQPPAFTPDDLLKNFERLQSDLNIVQNEFDQALVVWRTILESEKQEFHNALSEREKAWDQDEIQWQKDSQGYQQKIKDLETYFNDRLRETEKKAVHALNELDAAWQQERTRWQQTVTQQSAEFRQAQDLQVAAQQQMEQRIEQLTDENAHLQVRAEQVVPLENQAMEWQKEKTAWQEALTERLNQFQHDEEVWAAERQEKDTLIQSLQQQLVSQDQELQNNPSIKKQQENVHVFMNTLETQVAALEDFVQQVFNPRRRKTDQKFISPTSFRPPSSRANN